MKKIIFDTAVAQCQEWASCLLDVWCGASIVVVLAFFVYQYVQSYRATSNSGVKQFSPGVGLSEHLRKDKNLREVEAVVEIDKVFDDVPVTVRVRIKIYVNEEVCK